jgi:regulator of sigma E protease
MAGENPMDERTGDPGEFLSHPRWQRFIIAIAGPAMNIVLAVALLTVVYKVHYEYPVYLDQSVVLGWVDKDSPAGQAGLQAGDRVTRIDGIQNPTWEQLDPRVMLSPNQPLSLTVQRGDRTFETTITPEAMGVSQMGYVGWVPDQPNTVTDLEPGMPAEKAGIKEGDDILAVDGKPVPAIAAMIEMLKQSKSKPIDVTVRRDGKELTFRVQPVLADVEGLKEERYRIGIGSMQTKVKTLPLAAAFSLSRSSFLSFTSSTRSLS